MIYQRTLITSDVKVRRIRSDTPTRTESHLAKYPGIYCPRYFGIQDLCLTLHKSLHTGRTSK